MPLLRPRLFLLTLSIAIIPEILIAGPAIRVIADVPYVETRGWVEKESEHRRRLDLFLPAPTGSATAVLVWFHGGGLKEGDKGGVANLGNALAETGVAVATPNYRLHPDAHYPAYVSDAASAVAWVRAHSQEWNLDAGRVFVGGHSAGAYLAALLVMDAGHLREVGLSPAQIAGVVLMSGQMMTHRTVREERGFRSAGLLADDAAPIFHLRRETPPLLLLVADRDLPSRREENELFAAALRAQGHRTVELHIVADRDHGSIGFRLHETGDPAFGLIHEFIRRNTGTPPAQP